MRDLNCSIERQTRMLAPAFKLAATVGAGGHVGFLTSSGLFRFAGLYQGSGIAVQVPGGHPRPWMSRWMTGS
jgi:hypothetical protein